MRLRGSWAFVRGAVVGLGGGLLALNMLGCSGSSVTAATTPPPSTTTPPTTPAIKPKFAYSGNQKASLSGYTVDATDGTLTPISGFPLVLGTNPNVITHDPQNRFVIVGDIAANQLHVLAINATTGALTEVSPSPYATIKEPVAVTTDPAGTHVYVASQGGNQVGAYNLSSTGVLTSVTGGPFSTGSTATTASTVGAAGILSDAAGKFLYVQDLANVYVFGIDSTSGALTLLQTMASQYGNGIALDPAGSYLYAAGSNAILSYSISPTSGLLTLAKSSPTAEQNGAYTITVSPSGKFAYTIENNNFLVSYAVSSGAFTQVGTAYSGVYGEQITVDPSGSFVYVPQACSKCPTGLYNVIHAFSIGTTGALTPLTAAPFAAGVTPWAITVTSQ